MNKELEETIKELKYKLSIKDKKGFCSIGATTIETVLNYIDNSISKEVIEKKIEEIDKLIIETQKELGSASKEYMIYVYQKSILQELLEGK